MGSGDAALPTGGGPGWSFEVDAGDHFETPIAALEDVAAVLRFAARARARARGQPIEGVASRLRVYDPYFCTGRVAEMLGGLGFPAVVNWNRDFYRDIQEDTLPEFDVLLTNPPYSGDHKKQLFRFIVHRQQAAVLQGVPEPFLLLLPSWTVGKALFQAFLRRLAQVYAGSHAKAADARVFWLCRRGKRGRAAKYTFDHVYGAGLADCPFFGLWICGGFGDLKATSRAARLAAGGVAQGFWEPDKLWYPCRPSPASGEEVQVHWDDGTWSMLPPHYLSGGRLAFTSVTALEAAGLLRSVEEVRKRQDDNPRQRVRREVALQILAQRRASMQEARGGKRMRSSGLRQYARHEVQPEAIALPSGPGACRHYFSHRGCSRGESCRFSHSSAELA